MPAAPAAPSAPTRKTFQHGSDTWTRSDNGGWGKKSDNGGWGKKSDDGGWGKKSDDGGWGKKSDNGGWGKKSDDGGWGKRTGDGLDSGKSSGSVPKPLQPSPPAHAVSPGAPRNSPKVMDPPTGPPKAVKPPIESESPSAGKPTLDDPETGTFQSYMAKLHREDPNLRVIFFKGKGCKPCEAFNAGLDALKIPYKALMYHEHMELFEAAQAKERFASSVPQIFVDQKYIGDGKMKDQILESLKK
jgi:glutaredoxin